MEHGVKKMGRSASAVTFGQWLQAHAQLKKPGLYSTIWPFTSLPHTSRAICSVVLNNAVPDFLDLVRITKPKSTVQESLRIASLPLDTRSNPATVQGEDLPVYTPSRKLGSREANVVRPRVTASSGSNGNGSVLKPYILADIGEVLEYQVALASWSPLRIRNRPHVGPPTHDLIAEVEPVGPGALGKMWVYLLELRSLLEVVFTCRKGDAHCGRQGDEHQKKVDTFEELAG